MSYSENLKESPLALNNVTELHLTNTEIKELGPWVKGFSRLRRLVLNGMQKLVSLPQLPYSLVFLDAENCESLERLGCSFYSRDISLNFRNCFKLNQEARDLIMQTSTREVVVLPGREVPAYFTFRASGSSVTVKLNEKPLHTSAKFRACILLVNDGVWDKKLSVSCSVWSKQNALTACIANKRYPKQILSEHLYIFEIEAENVTSTELVFEFKLKNHTVQLIKECGILQHLELHIDEDFESLRDCDEYSNSSDSDYLSPVKEIRERRSSRSSNRPRRSRNYRALQLL